MGNLFGSFQVIFCDSSLFKVLFLENDVFFFFFLTVFSVVLKITSAQIGYFKLGSFARNMTIEFFTKSLKIFCLTGGIVLYSACVFLFSYFLILSKWEIFLFSKLISLWRRQWHPTPVLLPGRSHGREEPGRLQSMGSLEVRHD